MEQKNNMAIEVKVNGSSGYAIVPNTGIVTFDIHGISEREDIRSQEYRTIYSKYANERQTLQLNGGFYVPMWGEGHNLYPQEVYSTVSENKILPSLIEKQIDFIFGKGPRLYIETVQGEGDNQHRVRVPVENKEIQDWLDSWEDKGYPHLFEYLKNLITDYYYVRTCISKYNFNKSRRLGALTSIDALTYVGADEARLATKKPTMNRRVKESDCEYVIVGDWMNLALDFDVFPRFDPRNPIKFPSGAIAFHADKNFSKWCYAYNEWFTGLYDWIKSSNLSPRYLNSYLKNALNNHVHATIPGVWYEKQKDILANICLANITRAPEAQMTTKYKGVTLIDDSGKPYPFSELMMDTLIAHELRQIAATMSGEGKNQGKMYASIKWGEHDGWEFKEFPGKFKEYFDSVIALDKRADQVILAGKGISSSITNVENDGVISKSGSDVYYNYLIYIMSLTIDEYFITKEINRAIRIMFPIAKQQNIKLGFWIDTPAKTQETTASQRIQNTATADPTKPQ